MARFEAALQLGDRGGMFVELPVASRAAARANFEAMSYTCRKEYARWIAEAKCDDTKARRTAKAIVMLESGQKL